MEYFEILSAQNYIFFKKMMKFRDLECSYFTSESSFKNNTHVIAKSIFRNLTNPEKIKNSLFKLTRNEILILKRIVDSNSIDENIPEILYYSGFFLEGNNNTPVFHKNFIKIFNDISLKSNNQTLEQADDETICSDFIAYSLYAIVINSINMGKIKCLANSKPGIRMFECITGKISHKITKDYFSYFFNFLIATNLISIDDNPSFLKSTKVLQSRTVFYTNYFRYIDSNINDIWFKNLINSFKAKLTNAIYKKSNLEINEKTFNILVMCDFIKMLDLNKFVFTNLASQFLTKKKINKIQTKKTFYILPGFKLLMERNIDEKILSFVINSANILKYDTVFNVELDTKSLINAKKVGINSDEIVNFLKQHSDDVPSDLELMISDSHERYGEVKIFSKYNVIITESKHIKEKILNIDEILKYVIYSDDKNIILSKSKKPIDIKHLLIENNLIPEFRENKNYFEIKNEDFQQSIELLTKFKDITKKDNSTLFDKIEDLLDKLKSKSEFSEKIPPIDNKSTEKSKANVYEQLNLIVEKEMSLENKMNILNFAIGKKYSLNISYKQKGTDIMEERVIKPKYLDGDFLIAYCKLRKGTRRFSIYTIIINSMLLDK